MGAGIVLLILGCSLWLSRDAGSAGLPRHDSALVATVTDARERLFDSSEPSVHRAVDYAEGPAGAWWPKGESPLFAELVAEGRLPPVAERVGPEPVVLEGPDGIGNYGGTWMRISLTEGDHFIVSTRLSGVGLLRWSPMGYPLQPHLARAWEASPDLRTYTFHLRRGVRWSDGHPFTARDILYWWEQEVLAMGAEPPSWMRVRGETGRVEAPDDHTLRFVFPHPHGTLPEILAGPQPEAMLTPRHHLARYHPINGDQDLIRETLERTGLNSPRALYTHLKAAHRPEHPRLWPWIPRTLTTKPPYSFIRNPYFFAVDSAGNQLPYIDRLLFDVKSISMAPIALASGAASMQERGVNFTHYTMLMEGRERGDYEVLHWLSPDRAHWVLSPNINRQVVPDEPDSGAKAALLAERRFRQALSLAINRQRIIDAVYAGVGTPSQLEPGPDSPFHSPRLRDAFTAHDPAAAARLLDEIGLARRDREGMRTFADGRRMTFFLEHANSQAEGLLQFVIDDWAAVGVRAVARERSRGLFNTRRNAALNDFNVWSGMNEFYPIIDPRSFVPTSMDSSFAVGHARWYMRGGMLGRPDAEAGIAVAPPPGSDIRRVYDLYEEALASPPAEQLRLFHEIAEIAAENVWTIAIASAPPQPVVVRRGFRNVPARSLTGFGTMSPANAGIETFFWAEPREAPSTVARIKQEITTISTADAPADPAGGGGMGRLFRHTLWGILALALLLVALRHPFIGRRLLLMIPTLAVISTIVFVVIQMPPGDYVETRMMELESTGDRNAAQEVLKLREMFNLDEPLWKRYLRWTGLYWFATFDSADTGLLQGDLGRSMETLMPVSESVGDRVALTFWVSLGTILFTWAVALPIGIYSAVRQYSIGDYVLSFVGFIGMCVPNFLLAVLLMYWSGRYLGINVTGLFSPEYAAMVGWDWGKVVDLLKHIWVPIVVIATAGTAGMIRVMRGNLLDELRKPYVTTARAKGVRPLRLLLKYPVRMALNPFVSGLGGLFPQLVSGGAIVAIVLSLPMIGPVLVNALLAQNVYLAASMLLILSFLGVLGTLVSDLLLLWLDPRIRMEGGRK